MNITYNSIASYYDNIFPLNHLQREFVKSKIGDTINASILDLGCGTGTLDISLSKEGYSIIGIDADSKMIEIARNKNNSENVAFLVEDMSKIQRSFKPETFDTIMSMGNSIVHLEDAESIENLFIAAKSLLKRDGQFIGQIINYRRIFDKMVTGLPSIDNEHITFERNYQFTGPGARLDFKTRLFVKETNQIIENNETLYPLLPEEALFMLENAGFYDIELFGSFGGDALTTDSYSFIFVAK